MAAVEIDHVSKYYHAYNVLWPLKVIPTSCHVSRPRAPRVPSPGTQKH